ncbi:MAG: DNA-binding protein [Gammaproteobacteria bacterium RIFCSPHIGHO2_12_FULL_37_14]|nr:MAG: DNA-binding protein [Gammaproteobacteria bacterium RIFCSPHIGHO2_12_FULL_37_14]
MNRTERLLNLLKILRGYRYPVSGERLAERLNISIRTLYRDIATLQTMGAEIKGEAGVGYVLKPTFFLPPIMFTQIEIQALLLGTQWVSQFGDAPLSKGAGDALNKIIDVLPATIKNSINSFALRVGPPASEAMVNEDLSVLREAIANQKKIYIVYKSEDGKKSQRTVWPFTIGYFTDGRILVAWREKENDYRHFKTNRIISLKVLDQHYPRSKDSLFREWQTLQLRKHSLKHK